MVPVTCTTENNFVPYGNDLRIDTIPIREQLSIDNNIISKKVTTGNAPNNLEIIYNTVEDGYAVSEENSDEQGTVNKINVLPNQNNLTPITILVVDTISAV
jgi:hypothetical protein